MRWSVWCAWTAVTWPVVILAMAVSWLGHRCVDLVAALTVIEADVGEWTGALDREQARRMRARAEEYFRL